MPSALLLSSYSVCQSFENCWNEISRSKPRRAQARVIDPIIERKKGLMCESSGVGSSKNRSASVFDRWLRRLDAFLSTL